MAEQNVDTQPKRFETTPEARIKLLERIRLARRALHPDAGKQLQPKPEDSA
ncbi:hypothetical protein MKK69_30795 [Methylobacterium sp. J-026]|uniref:hypothetical protein n=1 Tax=Methylobacterium sp. J-026 TaxID=2836624 RepID=UPI001FB94F0D|nr:hypothetical protein [Methylobacterium sp. J-026]MCJ2138393.1 hypothetical protein [Methylobacterium sp. J-026]